MKRKTGLWLVMSIAMFGGSWAFAESPAPATQPAATADVQALIKQLQDDDFHVRIKAADQLKAMGKGVLPALKEAQKSPDPELHAQVDDIIAEFEKPPVDESRVPEGRQQNGAFSSSSYSVSTQPGARIIDVNENGRSIHIEQKADGIYMKVVGQLDGKPATREYRAKTADELKREHPNAFALFQQRAGNGGMFQIAGANGNANIQLNVKINGGPNGIVIGPVGVQQGLGANLGDLIKLNHLQNHLTATMRAKQLPDAQQKDVMDLLAKLRQAMPDPKKPEKEQETQRQEYARIGDQLRSKIADLKLGDLDALLPPKPEKAKE